MQVSVCMCTRIPLLVCVCLCARAEMRPNLSAALSDCTHERSQNNNKEPSVGRMKALSPTISAQRVSSPTVSLSDNSHITWRQEGEPDFRIWPQQIFFYVSKIIVGFEQVSNGFWSWGSWRWARWCSNTLRRGKAKRVMSDPINVQILISK